MVKSIDYQFGNGWRMRKMKQPVMLASFGGQKLDLKFHLSLEHTLSLKLSPCSCVQLVGWYDWQ